MTRHLLTSNFASLQSCTSSSNLDSRLPLQMNQFEDPEEQFDDADDENIGKLTSSFKQNKTDLHEGNKTTAVLPSSSSRSFFVGGHPKVQNAASPVNTISSLNGDQMHQETHTSQSNASGSSASVSLSPARHVYYANDAPKNISSEHPNYPPSHNLQQNHNPQQPCSSRSPLSKENNNGSVPNDQFQDAYSHHQPHSPQYAQEFPPPPVTRRHVTRDQQDFEKFKPDEATRYPHENQSTGIEQQGSREGYLSHSHHEMQPQSQAANMSAPCEGDRKMPNTFWAADALLAAAEMSEKSTPWTNSVGTSRTVTDETRTDSSDSTQNTYGTTPVQSKPIPSLNTSNIPTNERQKKRPLERPNEIEISNKIRVNTPVFLTKTFQMINECEPEVCTWTEEGDMFIVKDQTKLAKLYIPRFFDHSNFSSFTRQLHFYGFRKIFPKPVCNPTPEQRKTANHLSFYIVNFRRDRPDLLRFIRRSTTKGSRASNSKDSDFEEVRQEIDTLKQLINGQHDKVSSNMKIMGSEIETKLATITSQYDGKIASITHRYETEIASLTSRYDAKLETLTSRFEDKIPNATTRTLEDSQHAAIHSPTTVTSSVQEALSSAQQVQSNERQNNQASECSLSKSSNTLEKPRSASAPEDCLKDVQVVSQKNHSIKELGRNDLFVSKLIEDDEMLTNILSSCQNSNTDIASKSTGSFETPMHYLLLSPTLLKKILDAIGLKTDLPGTLSSNS